MDVKALVKLFPFMYHLLFHSVNQSKNRYCRAIPVKKSWYQCNNSINHKSSNNEYDSAENKCFQFSMYVPVILNKNGKICGGNNFTFQIHYLDFSDNNSHAIANKQ